MVHLYGSIRTFVWEQILVLLILSTFAFFLYLGKLRAWNRRVERLNNGMEAVPEAVAAPVASPDVWPPPPNRHE